MTVELFWKNIGKLRFSKKGYVWLRETLLWMGLIKHHQREKFEIGKLKSKISKEKIYSYLLQQGFEHSIYSWIDPGEVLSLRKIDGKSFQYHLRLYEDNMVSGHYEYAPDRRPLKHYFEHCFEPKKEYFKKLLGSFLVK